MRILNGISELLSNSALGGDSTISQSEAAELIDLLDELIESGSADGVETFADQIEGIAMQGRGPNHLEWALFRTSYEALQPDKEVGQEEAAPEETPSESVSESATDETDDEEEGDSAGAPV